MFYPQSVEEAVAALHLRLVVGLASSSVTVYTETDAVIMPIHIYTHEVHHVGGGIKA